jgi:hypothetical protein
MDLLPNNGMHTVAICCKSYCNDLKRAVRLAASVEQHNRDQIPLYVIVSDADRAMFSEALKPYPHHLILDTEIIDRNPAADKIKTMELDGGKWQQIVKSQFWRLGVAENAVVIDSDSYFIRDFSISDFMADETTPYTVMHDGKELLEWAERSGNKKVAGYFEKDRRMTMQQFGREGEIYDFGPTPCIWSAKVWRQLDEEFAEPQGKNFADLIVECPNEMLWYGEALLHFNTFAVHPHKPLFKVFHYEGQYRDAMEAGEDEAAWAKHYLGVVAQSNWDFELDLERRKRRSWKTLWLLKR